MGVWPYPVLANQWHSRVLVRCPEAFIEIGYFEGGQIMVFPDVLFAFVIGLLFTAIFALGFNRRGPWASIPVFFLLVFLAAWVGGAWAAPAGPALWGVYWLPFAVMGLLIALILAAAAPAPRSTVAIEDTAAERREERKAETAFEIFFWVLLMTMIIAILIRYMGEFF